MVKKTELYQPVGWLLTVLGLVTVGLGAGGDRVGLTTATVCVCTGLGVAVAGIVGIICGRKSEEGQLNVWTVGLTLSATLLSVTALVLNLQPLVCADPPDWTGDVTGYHQGYDGAIRDVAHEAKYQHAGQVIRIVSALYGRTQPEAVCGGAVYTTQCRSTTSLTVVQDRCNGQQSCSVTASNSEFGDPCVGTFKYLEIEYECTFTEKIIILCIFYRMGDGVLRRPTHCKPTIGTAGRTLAGPMCPDGQQIRVVSASYGRTDETVCGGPVHTTRCSSRTSLTVMKKVCDNRQSCVVSAENSVFGDPCVGTFKYLEVAYACNPAPEPPPPVTPRYLGCYEDHPERVFPSDRMDSDGMTSDLCIRHCREYGHQYAATQYAHECWCGSQGDFVGIGVRRPDSECDLPCPGRSMSDEMCGGTWRMSVYRTGRAEAPSHPLPIETTHSQLQRLGCWTDTIDRAVPTLEGSDPRLDGRYESRTDAVRKCRDAAARRGYTVFAIQNGGWCAASANALQTYHRYGRSDACRADGEGGPWANEVYKIVTGPQLQPGLVCEHSTMSIQCPAHKVIRIQSAMYGRAPGGSVCGTVYTGAPCRSPTSLPVLQERCDGREACSVQAENGVFGDPCVGTFKYLAVENECVGVSGYKGCYEDTESRRFPADFMSSEEMTSEMCVRHCKGNGHAYAATQYSRECWCGSEHHFDGLGSRRPETECDKPCPGNADQWCGGTWRMSVYSVQDRNVCEAPSTDTQYRYRWDLPRLTEDRFTFDVQANNDVHVGLSSQSQDLDDMYEIVIGGWSNTQSVIRRSKQGNNLVTVSTSGIISPTEYRKFWITWSSDGTIAVGKRWRHSAVHAVDRPRPSAHRLCRIHHWVGEYWTMEVLPHCSACRHIVFYVKISTSIMVALSLLACLLACWGYRRSSSKKSGVVNRNLVKLPPDIFSISTTPLPGPTHGMAPVGPAMPDDPPPPYSQDTLPHQATTDA
uniref:SUEL-type lectin domain-containing protein n=1 Tax=Branchiostoma floridae TaxID=7739 RepID=C3XWE1_BRAFL|eukprot:XP_002611665.1 hypothetical protein BRAFLDRAFT_117103 [Branchiostoma floridae]